MRYSEDGKAASNRNGITCRPYSEVLLYGVETSNKQKGDTPMPAEGKVCLPE